MKTIEELKAFLVKRLPNTHIYLFGSRATNRAGTYSDVDIAVEGVDLSAEDLARIRFAIEESNLPYKVDLVDLTKSPYLKQIVEKEGVVWQ